MDCRIYVVADGHSLASAHPVVTGDRHLNRRRGRRVQRVQDSGAEPSSWVPEVVKGAMAPSQPDDPLKDPKRIASLHRARLLDTPPEEAFDRLTRLAARILGVRVALVSVVDDKRQFFKSAVGLSGASATDRGTPLSESYCQHVVRTGNPLVVSDARVHPLLKDIPAIADTNSVSYCGVPIVDREGAVLGTLCVVDEEVREWTTNEVEALSDIAQSVIGEVHLRLLAAELADTNEALRDVIAMASHDVRSPLSVIAMYASLLNDDQTDDKERREFALAIQESARQATHLVSDLLEVSKIEAGAVAPQTTTINVSATIEAVVLQTETGDEVEVAVPAHLRVLADAEHFRRIVSNLVNNALAYGKPPFRIEAHEIEGRVVIALTDGGEGVSPDFVPRLFVKFARSDEARSSNPGGTGLGLAIVAGLAETNGGSIRYEPDKEHRSRFVVELPQANT